jgi:hypothetical protein
VRTAVYTGLVIWALESLLPSIMNTVTGLYSQRLMLYGTFAELVVLVVGTIVGAALYKEGESARADYPISAEARQTAR